ncbi:Hypothetical protein, putative [Bodo saltans]|uniref:Uncharacterized protein n=1 Tax=Bodo saltans TaxID=75058 RepID=A0A0S4KJ01_BODSA|nr:Hypothetical protein, putative [Bodo saltans]|eukprot:CUI14552.1 Hypothetical protein, putative [Bodo saltans]
MDRSIRYVREHKVAPLLNDMLTHLLLSQAPDPLTALIAYLEKKHVKDGRSSSRTSDDATPPTITAGAAVAASPTIDVSALIGLDEIVAEILRSEHVAQVQVERVAATLPKSALAAQPLLERFHKNSQMIAALAQQLAELHRDAAQIVATAPSTPASPASPLIVDEQDAVERIRTEALQLEKRLAEWLKNGDAAKAPAVAAEMVARALKQQEALLRLLSQL